jgi:hypothetical protein
MSISIPWLTSVFSGYQYYDDEATWPLYTVSRNETQSSGIYEAKAHDRLTFGP